jgi:hypothetical protein
MISEIEKPLLISAKAMSLDMMPDEWYACPAASLRDSYLESDGRL